MLTRFPIVLLQHDSLLIEGPLSLRPTFGRRCFANNTVCSELEKS